MARRKKLFALAAIVALQLAYITEAYAVSPICLFSKEVTSKEENEFQAMTLDDCEVKDDNRNIFYCTRPHSSSTPAIRNVCFCGGNKNLKNSDIDCSNNKCCGNLTKLLCRNGGTPETPCNNSGYVRCQCHFPFSGRRCESVNVTRKCELYTSSDGPLQPCSNIGEQPIQCLHTVNNSSFKCSSPVVPQPDDHRLTRCNESSEGSLEPKEPVLNPITEAPDEGPVTSGSWSNWSPWSVCSMSDNEVSTGPCMCRKRECLGSSCNGIGVEVSDCTVHGHWTDWTPWSACSSTRGRRGERTRYRFCSNPAPKFGGRPCDSRSESKDIQTESCAHDCPVSGSELQMTEFSTWANMTFEEGFPGWLKVRTKLVCQAPGGELEDLDEEAVAKACYLLKVSVEHCHTKGCAPLKGLRKLIEKNSAADMYVPEPRRPIVKPEN